MREKDKTFDEFLGEKMQERKKEKKKKREKVGCGREFCRSILWWR